MSGSPSPLSEGFAAKGGKLAFLIHADPSMSPELDNQALARQKRRRTSPEDQAVLEAEYQRNPKPDKTTRAEIVKRVSLGDKEVQIWFQNRRQKARTKAHSSEEHGAATHGRSASKDSLSVVDEEKWEGERDVESDDDDQAEQSDEKSKANPDNVSEKVNQSQDPQTADIETRRGPSNLNTTSPKTDSETQTTCNSAQSSSTLSGTQGTAITELASSQPSPSPAHTTSSGPGYLANRRSASFMKFKDEQASEEQMLPSASQPVPTLQRSGSSYLRLSMTEDGHAKVIDRAAQSPNPPRTVSISQRAGGLRRSHSVAGLDEKLRAAESDARRASKVPRTSGAIGRSRDSRAWEFWCDSDARNALGRKAELESSGSAANAISLIRASSGRAALQTNTSRLNMPITQNRRAAPVGKPPAGKTARPPLARASTSLARLQTVGKDERGVLPRKTGEPADDDDDDDWEQPNTDSDKENWEPEGVINPRRPHVYEPKWRPGRKALGENTREMSQSGSLGVMMARERNRSAGAEVDDEVTRFMGERSKEASDSTTSSGEELDCVQSLLSLSQGNWR